MIKDMKSLVGSKVLHFDTGEPLASLNFPIFNPDSGVVEAFWVKPFTVALANAVIQVGDIVEFKKHVYIKSEKVIADPADIIRLSDILSGNRLILGAPVRNEAGRSFGRVVDLSFSTGTYLLKQIVVQKTFLGVIPTDRRIFAWERILKVLPDGVIIDDRNDVKEAVVNKGAEPAAS